MSVGSCLCDLHGALCLCSIRAACSLCCEALQCWAVGARTTSALWLFTLPVQSAKTWKAASFLAVTFGSPKHDWMLIAWGWGECDLVHCFPELEPVQAAQNKTGKYVPPSLRDGASRRGESMQPNRRGKRLGIA